MSALRPSPTADADDDRHLVAEAVAGSQAAWASLYRRYSTRVASAVYRMVGADGELDDIVQETFVEAFRALAKIDDPSRLAAFLVTIAVRRIHRRMSVRHRVRRLGSELLAVHKPKTNEAARDDLHAIQQVLRGVPDRHRMAWVLHRVEGFSLPEAAAQCEVSLATAKRWISRVDGKLETMEMPNATG